MASRELSDFLAVDPDAEGDVNAQGNRMLHQEATTRVLRTQRKALAGEAVGNGRKSDGADEEKESGRESPFHCPDWFPHCEEINRTTAAKQSESQDVSLRQTTSGGVASLLVKVKPIDPTVAGGVSPPNHAWLVAAIRRLQNAATEE
ncbi:MAG: hypothetical protein M3032_00995 [Verrucomicrobiota bacterium]|nr:hypothetical protein [Verrucomicrobiota bacterium]